MATDRVGRSEGRPATHETPLPPASLILSTRERARFVRDLVASLSEGADIPAELVIVDQSDAPAPIGPDALGAGCVVRYVWSRARGLSRGRNAGIAAARHDVLVFVDDDVLATRDWFGSLVRRLVDEGPGAVVTGRVVPGSPERDGAFAPSTSPDAIPRVYRGRVGRDVLLPQNMAMYRSAVDLVGTFDPRLGAGSHFPSSEDNDFGFRLLEAGLCIAYEPSAVLVHRAWRPPGAWIPLRWSYGRGQGAYFAKHASVHDRYMVRRLWRDVARHAKRAPKRARSDPRAAAGDLAYAAAVLAGAVEWLATWAWRR
jgi:glycosyltransferase involved in cell wall biosynthesis